MANPKIVVAMPTIIESIAMAMTLLTQCCCKALSLRIFSAAVPFRLFARLTDVLQFGQYFEFSRVSFPQFVQYTNVSPSPFLLNHRSIPLLYALTISIFFLNCALLAEVRDRLCEGFLVDVHGVLCAVLAPMPPVIFTSSNVLHQSVYSVSVFFPEFIQYLVLINIIFYPFNINTKGKSSVKARPANHTKARQCALAKYSARTQQNKHIAMQRERLRLLP